MLKALLEEKLENVLTEAAPALNGMALDHEALKSIKVEQPRNADFGDYAVNVSSLARYAKMAPPQIAETVHKHWPEEEALDLSTVAGFVNFKLSEALLLEALVQILKSESPGKNDSMTDQSILLEYVSANPTGPLHIGHGRWAALGDSLVRLFRHCDATVTPEFYINDAGVQMQNIAISIWWRAVELIQKETSSSNFSIPEALPYPGEFVVDLAQIFIADPEIKTQLTEQLQHLTLDNIPPEYFESARAFTKKHVLAEQQKLLNHLEVQFDNWYSEQAHLHQEGLVDNVLETLKAAGYSYEHEGALWFKSEQFGDEKDRVLVKSDGSYTYLAADIAYHHDKFIRKNDKGEQKYNRVMNIWGADHHGYIPRMKAAIEALGHNPEQFDVLLGQLVNLVVDGEKVRMGKRRKMLTLADVVDEVGVDATRFWMVSKSTDTALDFDVELAASATDENPVFYVQYAHARCASILRNATQENYNTDTGEKVPPFIANGAMKAFESSLSVQQLQPLFDTLENPKAKLQLKALIIRLDAFEDLLQDAA